MACSTLAELLERVEPGLRPVFDTLRETILRTHRHVFESIGPRQHIASYGIGPRKVSDHYAYLAPGTAHITLGFYRGAFLNDPAGLLEGRGQRRRHIKIDSLARAGEPGVLTLLRQSISERLASERTGQRTV